MIMNYEQELENFINDQEMKKFKLIVEFDIISTPIKLPEMSFSYKPSKKVIDNTEQKRIKPTNTKPLF